MYSKNKMPHNQNMQRVYTPSNIMKSKGVIFIYRSLFLCFRYHIFLQMPFMTRYIHKINKRNLCIGKYIGLANNWKTFLQYIIINEVVGSFLNFEVE